jgi:hypothetical protein
MRKQSSGRHDSKAVLGSQETSEATNTHIKMCGGAHLRQVGQARVGSERHSQLLRPFIADQVVFEAVDVCLPKARNISREQGGSSLGSHETSEATNTHIKMCGGAH